MNMKFILILLFSFLVSPLYASEVILESHASEVKVAKLNSIPKGPNPKVEGNCKGYIVSDLTQISKTIAEKGWAITSQIQYGPFELISFAGSFESITSGMCIIGKTNVAVFERKKLVGLFYTDPNVDHVLASMNLDNSGKINVFSGGGIRALQSEFTFRNGRITLDDKSYKVACEGSGVIPHLSHLNIFEAKKSLLEYGWYPVDEITGSNEFMSFYEKDSYYDETRINKDLPELVTCSGTGVGYCKFLYETSTAYLEVDTAGGSDYGVVSLIGFCK